MNECLIHDLFLVPILSKYLSHPFFFTGKNKDTVDDAGNIICYLFYRVCIDSFDSSHVNPYSRK